jgi:hypothetical protein
MHKKAAQPHGKSIARSQGLVTQAAPFVILLLRLPVVSLLLFSFAEQKVHMVTMWLFVVSALATSLCDAASPPPSDGAHPLPYCRRISRFFQNVRTNHHG